MKLLFKKFMLPAYVISNRPFIMITYWNDFILNEEKFRIKLKEKSGAVIFQLGWHYSSDVEIEKLKKQITIFKFNYPNIKFVFFVNSKNDVTVFTKNSLKAVFCHQNAFIDEKKITLKKDTHKKYNAVYLARVSPFKRHHLSLLLKDTLYIGDYKSDEKDYANSIMQKFTNKTWYKKIKYSDLSKYFSQAKVGLCLSHTEGAMFASTEYQLAGIPVISTRSYGGRDSLFNNKYCAIVDDDEDAIRNAVIMKISKGFDPVDIRKTVFKDMKKHRQIFSNYINKLFFELGHEKKKFKWGSTFVHKWGLRSFTLSINYMRNRLWLFKF
jgi:glycosyltransferase involved in cell wall biosynthesis